MCGEGHWHWYGLFGVVFLLGTTPKRTWVMSVALISCIFHLAMMQHLFAYDKWSDIRWHFGSFNFAILKSWVMRHMSQNFQDPLGLYQFLLMGSYCVLTFCTTYASMGYYRYTTSIIFWRAVVLGAILVTADAILAFVHFWTVDMKPQVQLKRTEEAPVVEESSDVGPVSSNEDGGATLRRRRVAGS